MPRTPNRDPHAPQLGLEFERPEVASELFVDEALHEGLRLEGIQCTDVAAEKVELKRFVLTEVNLSGAKLDGLDLADGSITSCNLANLRSRGCAFERVVIESSSLSGRLGGD